MPNFDDQSARRIARTVRESERQLRGRKPPRARWHGNPGGTGAVIIRFETVSVGPFYLDTSAECGTVVATVLDVSCKSAGVSVNDEVTIWDPSGCWFNIPVENLENTRGTAVKMKKGTTFGISECTEEDETEGCFWMVQTLCCVEEVAGS